MALATLYWSAVTDAHLNSATDTERELLSVPIAVFILDAANGDSDLTSQRTVKSMESHFDQVNSIWRQADIAVEPVVVRRVKVRPDLLSGIAQERGRGGIARFFRSLRSGSIEAGNVNTSALIWTFFVRTLDGPNGLKPLGTNTLFVADSTTNNDYRVTSHELGHIFGLYHDGVDASRLLFSGTNGTALTDVEQTVARYTVNKMLRHLKR